jgi:hypothetical protein
MIAPKMVDSAVRNTGMVPNLFPATVVVLMAENYSIASRKRIFYQNISLLSSTFIGQFKRFYGDEDLLKPN